MLDVDNRVAPVKPLYLDSDRLREKVELAMQEGHAVIIADVGDDVGLLFQPYLNGQFVRRGRTKLVPLADRMVECHDSFRLYFVTRLANPHLQPELQANTTVVDFTVTPKGLEQQLLGIVMQHEHAALENQLRDVLASVTNNTKALSELDDTLLRKLTERQQDTLLDDPELLSVLTHTKEKAVAVQKKLAAAQDTRTSIDRKREEFRPVAARGSVLFFAGVDMGVVNPMYQLSLAQFLALFQRSMASSEKSPAPRQRVQHIVGALTSITVSFVSRGLYERHKLAFKLIALLRMLVAADRVDSEAVSVLLAGVGNVDVTTLPPPPVTWLPPDAWHLLVTAAAVSPVAASVRDNLHRQEPAWRSWLNHSQPERVPLPELDPVVREMGDVGFFTRLLLVRCLRQDRLIPAAALFIESMEWIDGVPSGTGLDDRLSSLARSRASFVGAPADDRLPAMGPQYVDTRPPSVADVLDDASSTCPVVFLLSPGSDPMDSVRALARRSRHSLEAVSLGEGQDGVANRVLADAAATGGWVLLQNCHLGLAFVSGLQATLKRFGPTLDADFRLFLTTEPHPDFPLSLLQSSVKMTLEAPAGLRAGLLRAYSSVVDQELLERVDSPTWRQVVYAVCFLHCVVQERRKFGALGWNVPYEFNQSDLHVSLLFLDRHLYSGPMSWPTVRYMVGEVQFGGRVTDDVDRVLLASYVASYLGPGTLQPNFTFNPSTPVGRVADEFVYGAPDFQEVEQYRSHVVAMPLAQSPEVFGLHPNADLTFRVKESSELLDTLALTRPSGAAGGTLERQEQAAAARATDLLSTLPLTFTVHDITSRVALMGGLSIPLNIFLFQELQSMGVVLDAVRSTLESVRAAAQGTELMTAELEQVFDALTQGRVPTRWVYTTGGDQVSWTAPSLGRWYASLLAREAQLRDWLEGGRPPSFWLGGFLNPRGFITAVKQEICRAHAAESFLLDDVQVYCHVTKTYHEAGTAPSPPSDEGAALVHGLFVEGARWSTEEQSLVESHAKELFAPMPLVVVSALPQRLFKVKAAGFGPFGGYPAPVYSHTSRTSKHHVFTMHLPCRDQRPDHWVLRGVAVFGEV